MNKSKFGILITASVLAGLSLDNTTHEAKAETVEATDQLAPCQNSAKIEAKEKELGEIKQRQKQEQGKLLHLQDKAQEDEQRIGQITEQKDKEEAALAQKREEEKDSEEKTATLNDRIGQKVKSKINADDKEENDLLAGFANQDQELQELHLLQGDIARTRNVIPTLKKQVKEQQQAKESLLPRIKELQNYLASEKDKADAIKEKVTYLQEGVNGADEQIERLKTLLPQALAKDDQAKAAKYRQNIADTEKHKQNLQKQLAAIQIKYQQAQDINQQYAQEIASQQEKVTALTGKLSILQDKLSEQEEQAADQQNSFTQKIDLIDFAHKDWCHLFDKKSIHDWPQDLQADWQDLNTNLSAQKEMKEKIALSLAAIQEKKQQLLTVGKEAQHTDLAILKQEQFLASLEQQIAVLEKEIGLLQENQQTRPQWQDSDYTWEETGDDEQPLMFWQGRWQAFVLTDLITYVKEKCSLPIIGRFYLKANVFAARLFSADGHATKLCVYSGQKLTVCEARLIRGKLMLRLQNSDYWLSGDQLAQA